MEKIQIYAMPLLSDNIPVKGQLMEIPATLEAKQKFVKGYIERVAITEDIDLIVNDSGLIDGLAPNRILVDDNKEVIAVLCGDIFACRHSGEEFTSIREEDIPTIRKYVKVYLITLNEVIFGMDEDLYYRKFGDLSDFKDK